MTDNVKLVLSQAADLIERNGWCQWESVTTNQAYDIVGAIGETARNGAIFTQTLNTINDAITGKYAGDVLRWNDHKGRTKEEVVGFLRRLASKEES